MIAQHMRRAQSMRENPTFSGSNPGLWHDALSTLAGCGAAGAGLFQIDTDRLGPPFFIRDSDIREWLAGLRRQLPPIPNPGGLEESHVTWWNETYFGRGR